MQKNKRTNYRADTAKKSLASVLPEGLLVDRKWLKNHGFNRPLVDYYLRAGQLEAAARGIYRRPGPTLKWEHVVYSLGVMGYRVHVGGRTALDLQGYSHYLLREGTRTIWLYGLSKLPAWVNQVIQVKTANRQSEFTFELHKPRLFDDSPEQSTVDNPFGHWDWPIPYAKPELALLELVAEVASATDFEVVDKYFESAFSLSPKLVTHLLASCRNVKAKRVFLWFCKRHGFSWLKYLELDKVDIGSGKRVVIKGGALDQSMLITVPRHMMRAESMHG